MNNRVVEIAIALAILVVATLSAVVAHNDSQELIRLFKALTK